MRLHGFDDWHRCHEHALEAELFKLRRLAKKLDLCKRVLLNPPNPETWDVVHEVLKRHGQVAADRMGPAPEYRRVPVHDAKPI